MMKILVVTQYFWPENFRINDLVQELVARGHEVTVLTGKPNYPDGKIFATFKQEPENYANFHGARIYRVPLVARGKGGWRLVLNYLSFALSCSLLGPFKLRAVEFEAIFVFEPSPITVGLPAALLRRLRHRPLAFWVLDLWPETLRAIGMVEAPSILNLIGRLVSFVYNRCDLILVQSRRFTPEVARYSRPGKRIEYFPSWAEAVHAADTEPAIEIAEDPDKFTVLFTGNIGEAQDFPAVLAAAEMLSDDARIRWVIVGDGRMGPWLRAEIARRKLGDKISMLGRFPVQRMPSFYRRADALLMPLKADPIFSMTIPGKLQSYLAAGVPIIAMLDGEGADVVRRAQAGLTCPAGDSEGLARSVLAVAAMTKEERDGMGRNGVEISNSEFHRDQLIGRLESWLQQLRIGDEIPLEG